MHYRILRLLHSGYSIDRIMRELGTGENVIGGGLSKYLNELLDAGLISVNNINAYRGREIVQPHDATLRMHNVKLAGENDIAPYWLTSTVMDMAEYIIRHRAWDHMPMLADALMDAGCDDEQILSICQNENVNDKEVLAIKKRLLERLSGRDVYEQDPNADVFAGMLRRRPGDRSLTFGQGDEDLPVAGED